jgi:anti-sigma factor RsiW
VAAAAAVVVGGISLFAAWPYSRTNDLITREAVSAHIRSLMANHLTDVASTDQHTVKPWFSDKLDFSPPVTDFAGAGYPLVGGRLDYLDGHAVAALVYQHGQHIINVLVWPVAGARDGVAPAGALRGFHVIHGTHAGMVYYVVSDLNAEDLATLARMLAASPARP